MLFGAFSCEVMNCKMIGEETITVIEHFLQRGGIAWGHFLVVFRL